MTDHSLSLSLSHTHTHTHIAGLFDDPLFGSAGQPAGAKSPLTAGSAKGVAGKTPSTPSSKALDSLFGDEDSASSLFGDSFSFAATASPKRTTTSSSQSNEKDLTNELFSMFP